jgi:hypothetical protein
LNHDDEHADDGQHFRREEHLANQISPRDQHIRRFQQRRREPGPRQDAAEHEQGERLEAARLRPRDDDREDERVDEEEQERVDEGPEEAEDGAAVARLQVARDEALHERAVAKELAKVGEQE